MFNSIRTSEDDIVKLNECCSPYCFWGAEGSFTYMCLDPIHPCAISRDPTKIPFPVELFRVGLDCGGGSRPDGLEFDPLSPKQTNLWKPRLFDLLIFDKNSLQNSFCRDFVDVFEKLNANL